MDAKGENFFTIGGGNFPPLFCGRSDCDLFDQTRNAPQNLMKSASIGRLCSNLQEDTAIKESIGIKDARKTRDKIVTSTERNDHTF